MSIKNKKTLLAALLILTVTGSFCSCTRDDNNKDDANSVNNDMTDDNKDITDKNRVDIKSNVIVCIIRGKDNENDMNDNINDNDVNGTNDNNANTDSNMSAGSINNPSPDSANIMP